ncbi:MAG TPA: TIM-barrel domain-containing protein [Bryobacteraceae bacterium]|nr:TIM-barrel domain-containing protein [Bryobacteraceae bacterium]
MSSFQYVNVQNFTPNLGQWTSLANVTGRGQNGNSFTLQMSSGPGPVITFLSNTAFRVRFNPAPGANLTNDISYAVVNRNLGAVKLTVNETASAIEIDTPVIRVVINKNPYGISVFRGNQLIHADTPTYNLVYIPGQEVIANFKVYPANARYAGFGEKAGSQLLKNNFTMTCFNWDNYKYIEGGVPTQGGPLNPSEPLYCSVPLLIETNPNPVNGPAYTYGLFLDNSAQSYFNVGASDYSNMFGKYYFGALYGDLDYYFLYGSDAPAVIDEYTSLTGRPTLPPRYVFGFHQGCYGYYDETILTGIAQTYRNAQIPIDGLHIDVDFQDNYRTFTSSNKKFPNAQQMFANLHQQGFKCSTNITPLVSANPLDENGNPTAYPARDSGLALNTPGQAAGAFIYDTVAGGGPNPNHFIGDVNYGTNNNFNPFNTNNLGSYGYYSDYGRSDVQTWWGQQYAYLVQTLGMDMIWQDMTCPAITNGNSSTFPLDLMVSFFGSYTEVAKVHNSYVLNLLEATFNGLAALRPNQRNFIIARGGFAGMQRYAALWTGDSSSDWDFLQINIPEVLNLGLSGIPISGCDIGGFAGGNIPDGTTAPPIYPNQLGGKVTQGITNYELLTRWMILGSFLPWYRNHYDGYNKQFQEPWAYGEPVPTNCRYFVGLRYRMLHIYYSAMYQASQTGLPIARALFLNDPNDLGVYDHLDDEFFVGHDVLVAPILAQHETASPPTAPVRDVYLPAGSQWYSFTDNTTPLGAPVPGGTLITNWYAPLSNPPLYLMPIYIRAGAILPMRELEQYVGQLVPNPITFNIYPGADSSFDLYLDDGISNQYRSGTYRTSTVSHQGILNGQSVRVLRTYDHYAPPEPYYFVSFLGTNPPSTVTAAGTSLPNVFTPEALAAASSNAYYYNQSIKTTFLKIFDVAPDITLEVTF